MVSRTRLVLAICAVLVFGVAVTQSPAGTRHKHPLKVTYVSAPVTTAPFDVNSGTAFCPSGTKVTGGGEEWVDGLATVDMGFAGNAYYVLVDNFDNSVTSQMNVQAACSPGTKKVKARPMSRAQVKEKLAAMVERLKQAHRAER
jgi:hypothetical protein